MDPPLPGCPGKSEAVGGKSSVPLGDKLAWLEAPALLCDLVWILHMSTPYPKLGCLSSRARSGVPGNSKSLTAALRDFSFLCLPSLP